jgi:hypothetical protein
VSKNKKKLIKKKKQSLIEKGYHVYLGTIRVRDKQPNLPPRPDNPSLYPDDRGEMKVIVTHRIDQGGCGADTIVVISETHIGKPFTYNCSGCSKILQYDQLLLREPDPNPNYFHLFGDESTAHNVVVYGILVLNDNDLVAAENDFSSVIESTGVPRGTRFHAKEVFFGKAREKSVWQHLDDTEVWVVARSLLTCLKAHRPMFCIGVVDQNTYPSKMPSGTGQEIQIIPEHLYGIAFQAAFGVLHSCGLTNSDTKIKLWIDPQTTKLNFWGVGKMQIKHFLKYRHINPEKIEGPKPVLLDAADLFAYIAGRAVSDYSSPNKRVCEELYELCAPKRGDGSWIPE